MAQKRVLDVFNSNVFSIPSYQRDYAWEEHNLDDLWEDLLEAEKVKGDEMGHFLGTIVVAKNPNNHAVYDIIDGQQRTTTIFMLRYALNFKTKDPNRNLNYFLDDNDNFRLQVIKDNQDIFKKILKQAKNSSLDSGLEQEIETDGQKRLYNVFKTIWSYVADLSNERAKELLGVLDNMVLMWLEEKDSGRAIRMFQTVNDRGMPLLLLDKLKSLLILYSNKHCNGKLDNDINERFGNIFKIITQMRKEIVVSSLGDKEFSKYLESRIFNYHALGQKDIGNYKYGADESYKTIKDLLKNKAKDDSISQQDLYKWIDKYSQDLLGFFEAFLVIMKKSTKNKELFKLLFILTINPYFYSSLVRLEMNGLLDNESIILLAQAEILLYGFGSANDSRAYQLSQFTSNKDNFKSNLKVLCGGSTKGGYKNFKEAFNEIADGNYEWGKYFHYLFFHYRCQKMDIGAFVSLLGDKKTYSYTIEHIVSQNVIGNGSLRQYGFENEDEFTALRDTFGNLLVLEKGLNSSNSDAGLVKKQENYKKSQIFYNKEFANREDFLLFNKNAIEKENEKFTKWAKEFFKDFL